MADETILIVEDNDILRDGYQFLLETEGYRVIPARHGQEALQQMQSATPDLILSDISMPEMDGYSFYDAVRARPDLAAIPFIFLTALGERDIVFTSKRLGVEDHLIKPVDRQELVTTVRSRLERSQQLMLAEMQQAYEASLIMLANAIELRDHYTRGHVERVRNHAVAIAQQLGWTDGHTNHLAYGSILHDIGKIHIMESVLSKPGPLDETEWNEMKKHPVIGAEMVKNISYLLPAIPIIRHHHERWDGTGYPDGLKGEHIPMAARIVAVADSLDAMITSRTYREALTPDEAYEEIQRSGGTHFDPAVVAAFQRAWYQIREEIFKIGPI